MNEDWQSEVELWQRADEPRMCADELERCSDELFRPEQERFHSDLSCVREANTPIFTPKKLLVESDTPILASDTPFFAPEGLVFRLYTPVVTPEPLACSVEARLCTPGRSLSSSRASLPAVLPTHFKFASPPVQLASPF